MSKLLGTVSALAVVALIALPGTAGAREQIGASMKNSNSIEVSSVRRHHRHYGTYRRFGWRPHFRHYGYYAPYQAFAYDPYYRPYYRPGFSVGVGPFGFGFGL